MEALPGLFACQCCRKFGSHVTFTIPSQEDTLAAEERRSAGASSMMKPLPFPDEEERNGPERD